MSGFTGIVHTDGAPVDRDTLQSLGHPLRFHGPGEQAFHLEGAAGFVYALLPTDAAHPETCSIPTLDGSLWIAADARVDAREDLLAAFDGAERSQLAAVSSAKLILHCYRRWGDDCVSRLLGDFSFALWDASRQRLFCARDHFGVKPFFYALDAHRLIVSNTLESIKAHPGVSRELNELPIADFLLFGSNKDPSTTAFSAIQRLPAGHTLAFEHGNLTIGRYWTPQWGEPLRYRRTSEYIDHFREVFERAVAARITSPKTALLMSGGLDSTAVAAAARNTGATLKAFNIFYDRLVPDRERHYSSEAAKFLDVPIEHLAADDYELYERTEQPELRSPEPLDTAVAALFFDHLRRVGTFSSVALSGQGGDALFAMIAGLGVHMIQTGQLRQLIFGAMQYLRLRQHIPPLGFRGSLRRAFTRTRADDYLDYPVWLNPSLESRLQLRDRWTFYWFEAADRQRRRILLDSFWPWLFENYEAGITNTPVDIRHPLFDLRVVNYCMGVSAVPWCIDKTLLRSAMRGWLPETVRLRPKSPVPGDPIAARFSRTPWLDSWEACPALGRFVQRNRIPRLIGTGTSPYPHLRCVALNVWLRGLTKQLV